MLEYGSEALSMPKLPTHSRTRPRMLMTPFDYCGYGGRGLPEVHGREYLQCTSGLRVSLSVLCFYQHLLM